MAFGKLFLTPKMENPNPDGLEVVAFNSVARPHPFAAGLIFLLHV